MFKKLNMGVQLKKWWVRSSSLTNNCQKKLYKKIFKKLNMGVLFNKKWFIWMSCLKKPEKNAKKNESQGSSLVIRFCRS